jgi:hypothetical protein
MSATICHPCVADITSAPDKVMGPDGAQAKMWMKKFDDGRQVNRMHMDKGFDWTATVKPLLPGCPDWCPAAHFGYLESGQMDIKMKDGAEKTFKAGETYMVDPGRLGTRIPA